jgi:hypothetical protein
MMKATCKHCGEVTTIRIPQWQAQRIREFKNKYPWITNEDLGALFNLKRTRISEIINNVKKEYVPRNQ